MLQLETGGIFMLARIALLFVISFAALGGTASAQAVLEGDPAASLPGAPVAATSEGPATEWGLGIRLRNVRIPQALVELFVDRATAGGSNYGIGVDLVRRKADFEVQLGVEYEKLSMDKGIWIESGKPIPENEADFVEFNDFGWFTLEATFLFHTPLTKVLALRYGAGAGVGVLFGDVTHVDRACESSDPESCTVETNGGQKIAYDLPPVMPVLNAVVGLQVRPIEKMTINVEGGIRTLPFFGVSGTYFF
jgi:hypothetical protein